MAISELAPWIAIAITLALSILVPLFTQIANKKNETVYRCSKLDFLKTLPQEKIKEDKKIVNLS